MAADIAALSQGEQAFARKFKERLQLVFKDSDKVKSEHHWLAQIALLGTNW